MANEIINVNEMQIRSEAALLDFFETYKIKHTAAGAAFPLDRTLGDWLDDLQGFLDMREFIALGVRPPLREVVAEAAIASIEDCAADAAADRTGAVIDFPNSR